MQTEEKVPLEDSESEDIIIADEASLPEDGKVYPKEAHPNAGKQSRPAGLLPGGADYSDESDESDERNVKYFVPKFSPEAIEEFLFDLMLCVRTSVLNGTKIADKMNPKSLPGSAFVETHSYELNRGGTDHKVFLMDYSSAVFHFIREAFGVSSSAFLLAWSANDIKNAQVETSSLVYSCDKKYVAMALQDRDLHVLLEMLPKYYNFVRDNPNTFLLKMYGLLRLQRGKKMMPFLLMENVFHRHIPLHYMYHLAGSNEGKSSVLSRMSSTLRRRSSSASKMTLSRSRGSIATLGRPRASSLVLDPPVFAKDKSGLARSTVFGNEDTWKAEGRAIMVDRKLRQGLQAQLEKDLALLRDCGITNHKLMVGIHEGEPIAPPSPDLESKRLVKVPSIVVFQSAATPVIVKSSSSASSTPKKNSGGQQLDPDSPTTPAAPIAGTDSDLSNLRRAKRVSVQSVDAEQPVLSPYRTVKGGLHSRMPNREELYYIAIIDIFSVQQKDKRRQEKALSRFAAFKEWLQDNIEEFEDKNPEPSPMATAPPGRKRTSSGTGNDNNVQTPVAAEPRLMAIAVKQDDESAESEG